LGRDPKEIAKQLSTYADAITAFSFAEGVVFSLALGSDDFKRNVLHCPEVVFAGIILSTLIYLAMVLTCHVGEDRLIGRLLETKADYWAWRVRLCRIGIIVFGAALPVGALYVNSRGQFFVCHF
jgi:hypothetical protein